MPFSFLSSPPCSLRFFYFSPHPSLSFIPAGISPVASGAAADTVKDGPIPTGGAATDQLCSVTRSDVGAGSSSPISCLLPVFLSFFFSFSLHPSFSSSFPHCFSTPFLLPFLLLLFLTIFFSLYLLITCLLLLSFHVPVFSFSFSSVSIFDSFVCVFLN